MNTNLSKIRLKREKYTVVKFFSISDLFSPDRAQFSPPLPVRTQLNLLYKREFYQEDVAFLKSLVPRSP